MRTQDQKRAQNAYNIVETFATHGNSEDKAKFKTLVLKFPAMILQNGLLAGLAFIQHKDKTTGQRVFKAYNDWLTQHANWINWAETGDGNVVARLCHSKMTVERYRHVTREALAYAIWLKRAAEALLADVDTSD